MTILVDHVTILVDHVTILVDHMTILVDHMTILVDHMTILVDHMTILVDHMTILVDHMTILVDHMTILVDHMTILVDHMTIPVDRMTIPVDRMTILVDHITILVDHIVIREQWIRAKYERKEFLAEATDDDRTYTTGHKKGFLFKKKKVDNVWQSRFFVLDGDTLRYFKKITDPHPTETIPLMDLNVTLNGQTGHPHGMQITALIRGKTRNYYVYSESGHDIMNWYCTIRAARLKLLQEKYPSRPMEELYQLMSRDFTKAGYLHKTPPNKPRFQKRYFVLDQERLMYFEKPTDAFPLGEIIMGNASDGFSVDENAPYELGGGENAFILNTPLRTYPLLAETSEEKVSWIAVLRAAIERVSSLPNGGGSVTDTYNTE